MSYNKIIMIILIIALIYAIYNIIELNIEYFTPVDANYVCTKIVNNNEKYLQLSDYELQTHGKAILTKSILKGNQIIFQATLYTNGALTYSGKQVVISPTELQEIIRLKNIVSLEKPNCCPDYDYENMGLPYITFHDSNISYLTAGSCLASSMEAFTKLDEILRKNILIESGIWI